MDTKGWGDLDTRQWWFGVLVIAGSAFIAAVTTGRATLAIVTAGTVVWAIGEWIQHPFQQFRKDGLIGSTYKRIWSVSGVLLDIFGIGLVVFGVLRFWSLGGRLF